MRNLKKIGLLLLFSAIIFQGFAQNSRVKMPLIATNSAGTIKNPDTTVNADTEYLYLGATNGSNTLINSDGHTNTFGDAVYEWNYAPVSATTGTVIAQGSMTGTFVRSGSGVIGSGAGDWCTLISDVTQYNGSSTVNFGPTATNGVFIIPKNQFKYVRLRFVQVGTGSGSATGNAWFLSHN